MSATTPNARNHDALSALASRYVDVDALPWENTRFNGIRVKTLMTEPSSGLLTTLVEMSPGAILPDHEHTDIEQTYVLSGHLVDDEGEATQGHYVWRPAGSRHTAHSPNGALLLSVFTKPNRFFDIEDAPAGFQT